MILYRNNFVTNDSKYEGIDYEFCNYPDKNHSLQHYILTLKRRLTKWERLIHPFWCFQNFVHKSNFWHNTWNSSISCVKLISPRIIPCPISATIELKQKLVTAFRLKHHNSWWSLKNQHSSTVQTISKIVYICSNNLKEIKKKSDQEIIYNKFIS